LEKRRAGAAAQPTSNPKSEARNTKQIQMTEIPMLKPISSGSVDLFGAFGF
jgi:hypothetical protein